LHNGIIYKLDLEALLNLILYYTKLEFYNQNKNYYVRKIDQIVEDLKLFNLLEARTTRLKKRLA
jgi:hypothetical protein